MKINKVLIGAIGAIASIAGILAIAPSNAFAQYNSGCTVQLVGRERGSRINMRSGPGTEYGSPSYLLVGQSVTMLDNAKGQRVSRQDSEGYTWYLVEYEPSSTRGWLREDFIAPQCNESY